MTVKDLATSCTATNSTKLSGYVLIGREKFSSEDPRGICNSENGLPYTHRLTLSCSRSTQDNSETLTQRDQGANQEQ